MNHHVAVGRDCKRSAAASSALSGDEYAFANACSFVSDGLRWQVALSEGLIPLWVFSPARRVPGTRAKDYAACAPLLWADKSATVGEVVKDPAGCDLAVVDIEIPGAVDRIRGFVTSGTPVLAYGSHVLVDLLRGAREAGAAAVPNSEVERRLLALQQG